MQIYTFFLKHGNPLTNHFYLVSEYEFDLVFMNAKKYVLEPSLALFGTLLPCFIHVETPSHRQDRFRPHIRRAWCGNVLARIYEYPIRSECDIVI